MDRREFLKGALTVAMAAFVPHFQSGERDKFCHEPSRQVFYEDETNGDLYTECDNPHCKKRHVFLAELGELGYF